MKQITLQILRTGYGGEDDRSRWERFDVPVPTGRSTVLDALIWARRHTDPTLAFRNACRVGMCGTCGVRVDGRETLACRTYLQPSETSGSDAPEIRIEPLRILPIVQDLITDRAPLHAAIDRLPGVSRDDEPASTGTQATDPDAAARDCILCGLCVSACSVAGLNPGFLGPAALVRASVALDARGGPEAAGVLDAVGGSDGATGCHTLFECTAVCPRGVAPTVAIQRLKRRVVKRQLGRLLRTSSRTGG
ncbi:MAG: 2Fe-2S iron-sulfur cluster-binding protein [Dehalococcoidia bacterium]|jgi:succinate dehydrogenase/fumarate reductase iron-sulfur protein|nr:2Fe-2S iron-sulfur cluster-binding protein [Dehalococcoidia bacterium]